MLPTKETKIKSPIATEAEESTQEVRWIRRQPGSDGNIFLSVGQNGNRFIVRYSGVAEFTVDVEQAVITWRPLRRLDPENRENAIRLGKNQVIPMLLSMGNRLVLHASAVSLTRGQGVAFSAPSGYGKSTLAEILGRPPHTHYADDWIAIENNSSCPMAFTYDDGIEAIIAPEKIPLTPAQEVGFALSDLTSHRKPAIPLQEIFILSVPETAKSIELKSLGTKEKFVSLTKNLFRLDSSAPAQLRKELALTTELVTQIPVTALHYPRKRKLLPKLAEQIQRHSYDRR